MILRKQATLDRFEGKQAILLLDSGQELAILKEELPGSKEGMVFVLTLLPDHEASLEKEALARTLLNQILADPSHEHGARKSTPGA